MQTRRHFVASSASALLATASPRLLHCQFLLQKSAGPQGDLFSNANLGGLRDGLFTQAKMQTLIGTLFMVFIDDDLKVDYMRLLEVRTFQAKAATVPGPSAPAASSASVSTSRSIRVGTPVMEAFTMIFSNGKALPAQRSYLIDHGTLGRFTLFLVPSATVSGEPRTAAYFGSLDQAVAMKTTGR